MSGLFGNIQQYATQPMSNAAMQMDAQVNAPVPQQDQPAVDLNAMSPEQQALNQYQAEQAAPKYRFSVGDPHLDKYIKMFLGE